MGALVKRGGLTQVLKVYTARHIPCDLYPKISFLIAQSGLMYTKRTRSYGNVPECWGFDINIGL